jgi:hypothetical protein
MKKSNIIIGLSALSLVVIGFLVFKNKKKQEINVELEEEVEFENADGKTSTSSAIKPKKIVKVKDYQNLLLNTNVEKLKKDLIGKKIYTSISKVKILNKPNVSGGFFSSNNWFNRFTIKNKGSFVGQVADVISEDNGKRYFLAISEKGYNEKLYQYLKPFLNPNNKPTKYKNWIRTADVVVDLN